MMIWILGSVFTAYVLDVFVREKLAASRAQALARAMGKPLLNVGSGYAGSSATGAKLRGDVNCDLAAPRGAPCGPGVVCHCDVQSLPFADKQFGVALAANVLRYVPDRARALRELHRVAEVVIVSDHLLPWPQIGAGPTLPVNGLPVAASSPTVLDLSARRHDMAWMRSRTLGDLEEVSRVVVGGVREQGSSGLGDLVMVLEGVRDGSGLGQQTRTLSGDPRLNTVERVEVEK